MRLLESARRGPTLQPAEDPQAATGSQDVGDDAENQVGDNAGAGTEDDTTANEDDNVYEGITRDGKVPVAMPVAYLSVPPLAIGADH